MDIKANKSDIETINEKLTNDIETIKEQLTNDKDTFETTFNDVTSNIEWISGKYIQGDGTFQISDAHSYAEIPVYEGLECEITGAHSWLISCYVIKDKNGRVILEDGASTSTVTTFNEHLFTIPSGGVKLYINKYSFKKLQLKNKLSVITNVKSPLDKKTIIFTGDSICQAVIEGSTPHEQFGWSEIIK